MKVKRWYTIMLFAGGMSGGELRRKIYGTWAATPAVA